MKPTALTLTQLRSNCTRDGDCLVWNGPYHLKGFPLVYDTAMLALRRAQGKKTNTMRSVRPLVWHLARRGPVPAGHRLVMTCGNKGCLTFAHMEPMTLSATMRFHAQRGCFASVRKQVSAKMNARKSAKLDEQKAQLIRDNVKKRGDAITWAKLLNVSPTIVRQVARGERWKPTAASSIFALASSAANEPAAQAA